MILAEHVPNYRIKIQKSIYEQTESEHQQEVRMSNPKNEWLKAKKAREMQNTTVAAFSQEVVPALRTT